jgi:biopolymer transport protein ExbB
MFKQKLKWMMFLSVTAGISVQSIQAKSVVEYFRAGGDVMWVLLLLSVLVVTFTIERLIVMFRQKRKMTPEEFINAIEKELKKNGGNKLEMAKKIIPLCEKRGGAAGSILGQGLKKYMECVTGKISILDTKQLIAQAMEERGRIEIPLLEARLSIIAMCANVAPLVGLLGTVIGMISAFETMSQSKGGAKPDELSGDISVALITTAGGLILAIPTLIIFNFLRGRAENYILDIEEASIQLADTLLKKTA